MRNPMTDVAREAVRQARVATAAAQEVTRPMQDESGAQKVGENDPSTGEWKAYGLVGVTRIGDGFRVRG